MPFFLSPSRFCLSLQNTESKSSFSTWISEIKSIRKKRSVKCVWLKKSSPLVFDFIFFFFRFIWSMPAQTTTTATP